MTDATDRRTYREKFLDPRWQRKRLEILQRDNFKCVDCEAEDQTLHVHHTYYKGYSHDPWDYPDYSLITLCVECHRLEEECLRENVGDLRTTLAVCGINRASLIETVLAAFAHGYQGIPLSVGEVIEVGRAIHDKIRNLRGNAAA